MGTFANKRHFLMIGFLTLLLFLLAGCGINGSTITGKNSPRATATEPPVQHCGTIHTLALRVVPTDQEYAQGVENCFWQAYQQCHPATLVYTQGGVDTATIHTFSLEKQNGKCAITDALQHIIYPHSPTTAARDTCAGLAQQADGLHFLACNGEGDILVPGGIGKG